MTLNRNTLFVCLICAVAALLSKASRAQSAAPVAVAATAPAGKSFTFSGRELLVKFTLNGDWIEADKSLTLAGTSSRLVPLGQAAASFNQRVAVLELPTWVNPSRLGKEYLAGIMDDCASGTLKAIEKGNVSQFATDILLLECNDPVNQSVKLAFAALVQTPRAHLVFSRMVRLPPAAANPSSTLANELTLFKQIAATLYVCSPVSPAACR